MPVCGRLILMEKEVREKNYAGEKQESENGERKSFICVEVEREILERVPRLQTLRAFRDCDEAATVMVLHTDVHTKHTEYADAAKARTKNGCKQRLHALSVSPIC